MSVEDENQITPRDYQQTAIDRLEENEWQGILEMATGTGKTITSLLAADNYYEKHGRIFIIIIVPFVHLVDQWAENIRAMDLGYPLKCYGLKKKWLYKLSARIRDFKIAVSQQECIITTYKTATAPEFGQLINKINNHTFLIADECHYFGINSLDKDDFLSISARVGLSATPDRWWDEAGTEKIYDYFDKVVFNYDLKKAIKNDFLVEYRYQPLIVGLTFAEIEQYKNLTKKIVYLRDQDDLTAAEEEKLKTLNLKRSWIISKAENKKELLYQKIFSNKAELSHTIIYCAPGEIDEIVKEVSKRGIKVHKFNAEVSMKKRNQILTAFAKGKIQVLVAIKCLDEGVDIPSTKEAYFLASTSNPKEFIQRRGRILRKSKNKNIAEVYDFMILPTGVSNKLFRSIAYKEVPRFAEFSRCAINKYQAREKLRRILSAYNLEYLMDKLPWELYQERF